MTPTKRAAATAFAKERLRWREVKGVAPVEDPEYLDWVRRLECAICKLRGLRQMSRTEAAHVQDRGMRQKCSDRGVIPLCAEHHRTSAVAHHRLGRKFWAWHGLDRDVLVEQLNREYDRQKQR